MNIQDYTNCVQNIHRDTHNLMILNSQIHQGMLQLITNNNSAPPRHISRTPAQIVRRTTPPFNYLNNFLQPVEVAPSSDQLHANTTMSTYENITNQLNNTCPIRGESFNPRDIVIQINTCQHIYFVNEFYGWFRSHVDCPLCRRDIREVPDDNLLDETFPSEIDNAPPPATPPAMRPATRPPMNLYDLSYNIIDDNLLSSFNFDDISLNNRYHNHISNEELTNMQNDPHVLALQTLTETIAAELTNQLQYNSLHNDLSNSDIELSLSFGSH